MRHLMSPLDFTVEELDKLLDLANDIEASSRHMHAHICLDVLRYHWQDLIICLILLR